MIGYARCSTGEQDHTARRDALRAGEARVAVIARPVIYAAGALPQARAGNDRAVTRDNYSPSAPGKDTTR